MEPKPEQPEFSNRSAAPGYLHLVYHLPSYACSSDSELETRPGWSNRPTPRPHSAAEVVVSLLMRLQTSERIQKGSVDTNQASEYSSSIYLNILV